MSPFFASLFTPPQLHSADYEHELKYLLAYRMCMFLALMVGTLDIVLLFFDVATGVVGFTAFLVVLYALIHIRKTGNYFGPMLTLNIFGAIACQYTLYIDSGQPHFIIVVWMVINVLLTFLVLGERLGIIISVFHCIGLSLFYLVFMREIIDLFISPDPEQIYSIIVNITICFAIICYLSWQNIYTNKLSKSRVSETQDAMQEQYNVISKQNEEKTVMLKEIHHRVKNNLQIITSLLRLQARELENPEAIAKFKDATHRVIAMSMIHEKMYQSDHLSTLHMKEYLHDLSGDLVTSYQSGYQVSLHIECDVDSIGLRSIVPLALILNELISNTLKYAFDDYDNCLISIEFMRYDESGRVRLTYSDTGTWKAPTRRGSFGLDLIDSLTNQLEGSMTMDTFPQTRFEFIFRPTED